MALQFDCLACRSILGLRRLCEDNLPVLDTVARIMLAQLLADVIEREISHGGCTEAEYAAYVVGQAEACLGTDGGK